MPALRGLHPGGSYIRWICSVLGLGPVDLVAERQAEGALCKRRAHSAPGA